MSTNRREFLAALLSSPAFVAGCAQRANLPLHGELLGQSAAIGHRLRDGFRPTVADDQWHEVDVAIIGAGAAGLSAAWKLKNLGVDNFVVLELESVIGGTARSGKSDVTRYPWGAHYVPVPLPHNRELIDFFTEMHVVQPVGPDGSPIVAEQYLCREPEERLFYRGHWIDGLLPPSTEDADQVARFEQEISKWVEWRDDEGRSAFAIPTRLSSPDPRVRELDRISMSDWMDSIGITSPRLKWFIDYSCRDDYGLRADETSAWAGLLYYAGRVPKVGAEPQPFITFPEGNGRIVNHLADQNRERIHCNQAVAQIVESDEQSSHPLGITCWDTKSETAIGYRAKRVIFALPQFLAPRLIPGFRAARQVDQFDYGAWIVANIHLSDRPREKQFPLSWDNVIYDSSSLGYVVATHQSGQDHGPTVLTWYLAYCDADGRAVREQLLKAKWEQLAELVLRDLEIAHPEIRKLTTRLDLFRWGHAMIRPKPGFIFSSQRREAQTPIGRIHFANTDLSGIALFEEAFDHGCRAAMEVATALKV